MVLMKTARCTSAATIRELRKKHVLFTSPGRSTACLGPHGEVTGRERERESTDLVFIIYWGLGWGDGSLAVSLFIIVKFKT